MTAQVYACGLFALRGAVFGSTAWGTPNSVPVSSSCIQEG